MADDSSYMDQFDIPEVFDGLALAFAEHFAHANNDGANMPPAGGVVIPEDQEVVREPLLNNNGVNAPPINQVVDHAAPPVNQVVDHAVVVVTEDQQFVLPVNNDQQAHNVIPEPLLNNNGVNVPPVNQVVAHTGVVTEDQQFVLPVNNDQQAQAVGQETHGFNREELRNHLSKARNPSETEFLEPEVYYAFCLNVELLDIEVTDPKKFKDHVLCGYPKAQHPKYNDGVTYVKGRLMGGRINDTVKGKQFTVYSRYTPVSAAGGSFTIRRIYSFKEVNSHVIVHYREVPNDRATDELLAQSVTQPSLETILTSLNALREETEVKFTTISSHLEAQQEETRVALTALTNEVRSLSARLEQPPTH